RFEVDGRLATLSGTLQRDMRARFTDRIGELGRTYQETAAAIERSLAQDAVDRDRRLAEIQAELSPLDGFARQAEALQAATTEAA
ncbi:MAG TPA: hypothetical protein VLR93_05340, partial [Patescibacteria group bacterium]|nr:hypothetical protein [Patescibacteria group bacterium]